jgi:hypothetical protein
MTLTLSGRSMPHILDFFGLPGKLLESFSISNSVCSLDLDEPVFSCGLHRPSLASLLLEVCTTRVDGNWNGLNRDNPGKIVMLVMFVQRTPMNKISPMITQ